MFSGIILFLVIFSAQNILAHDSFCTWYEHKSDLYGHEYWDQSSTGDIYTVSTCYAATEMSQFVWVFSNGEKDDFPRPLSIEFHECTLGISPEQAKENCKSDELISYPFYVYCAETGINCYNFTVGTCETRGYVINTEFTPYLQEGNYKAECGESRTLIVEDYFCTWFEHKSLIYGYEYWKPNSTGDIYTVNVYYTETEHSTLTLEITNKNFPHLSDPIPLLLDDCVSNDEVDYCGKDVVENNQFYTYCATDANSYNFTFGTCTTLEEINNTMFTIKINDKECGNRTLVVDDSFAQIFYGERTSYKWVIIVGLCMSGLIIFQSIIHSYLIYSTNQVKQQIKIAKKRKQALAPKINPISKINKKVMVRKRITKKQQQSRQQQEPQQPNHYDTNEVKLSVRTPANDDVIKEMKKSKFYKKEKQQKRNPDVASNDMMTSPEYDVVAGGIHVIYDQAEGNSDDVIYDQAEGNSDDVIYDQAEGNSDEVIYDDADGEIFGDDEFLDIYGNEGNSRQGSVYENWPQQQHDDNATEYENCPGWNSQYANI